MTTKTCNKVIVYDDNCPLCKAYTKAFVKTGFLQQKNRLAFTNINANQFNIDWQRAKHEIPLVDTISGKVLYGVDALVCILAQKIPILESMMQHRWIAIFFKKLYRLISYNRKLIVAKRTPICGGIDCTPDYSYRHRWLLCLLCYNFTMLYAAYRNISSGTSIFVACICLLCVHLSTRLITTKYARLITDICVHTSIIAVVTVALHTILTFIATCMLTTNEANQYINILLLPFALYLFIQRLRYMHKYSNS